MPTDTDSSEIATIRAAAQFEAEKKQEKLKSFDFVNRWIEIRQLIFGKLPDVKGEKPNQLIRDAVNNDYYPRPELVAELYLPNFAKLVDEYEAKILNLNEPEKTRAGLRLCAVIVHIGLKIHQANKQPRCKHAGYYAFKRNRQIDQAWFDVI